MFSKSATSSENGIRMPRYREVVESLRDHFVRPDPDCVSKDQVAQLIARLLAQGERDGFPAGDELAINAATEPARLCDQPTDPAVVTRQLVDYLSGLPSWGHPRAFANFDPTPTFPSVLGSLIATLANPNLVSDESAGRFADAEKQAIAMAADLVGFTDASSGVFTFGGTGTLLYAVRIGIEKACPGSLESGLPTPPPVILCSEHAHHACMRVASWLGLGTANVVRVPATPDGDIRTCLLESHIRQLLREERPIAAIIATVGTTDSFALDDISTIREMLDDLADEFGLETPPHLHADAVIGWAWSVFNDYDFEINPLQFSTSTVEALSAIADRTRHLRSADSVGIDFHKTGFAPNACSAFLASTSEDLLLLQAEIDVPYLFNSGDYHPGKFTLETTRSATGPMAALANSLLLGRDGLRSFLGHAVAVAHQFQSRLANHPHIWVVSPESPSPVVLFRVYTDAKDCTMRAAREISDVRCREELLFTNDYNRQLFRTVRESSSESVIISMTECFRDSEYGTPINALKAVTASPFTDATDVEYLVRTIDDARQKLATSDPASFMI